MILGNAKVPKRVNKKTYFNQNSPTIIIFKRLGTIFLHFTRRSTIHGLNHLAQARSAKRRLFWLFISTCATLGFFVNLFYLVEKFIQTPVLTNTFHDYTTFMFPDITFCLVNPIRFPPKQSSQYGILTKAINEFLLNEESLAQRFGNLSKGEEILPKLELTDYLFIKSNISYSHSSWSAIVVCIYLHFECTWEHFDVHFVWPYGNCFTFNVTKMNQNLTRDVQRNMRLNGFRPDFRIIIYKSINKFSTVVHDPFNDITKPSGVLVMIHEIDTYPHVSESFIVDSYTQVDLKITTKTHLESLQKCNANRENYTYCDYRTKKCQSFQGKNIDCVFEIIQNKIAKNCQCQMHTMPVLIKNRHYPFCYTIMIDNPDKASSIKHCLNSSIKDVDKNLIHAKCYKDLCSHPSYSTVISHSKYPAIQDRQTHLLWLKELTKMERIEILKYGISNLFQQAIKKNHSTLLRDPNFLLNVTLKGKQFRNINNVLEERRDDLINELFVNQNFMQLRFVPSSLFMDHIEETEEYPLSRLLSDIGGCVGLWVGASLITIFEFFDLLMDLSDILRIRPLPNSRKDNKFGEKENGNENEQGEDLVIENLENMMMKMMEPSHQHRDMNINHYNTICNSLRFEDSISSNDFSIDLDLGLADTELISDV